jgi:hypothetical protein
VRRIVPWALASLLGLSAGLGAWLGLTMEPTAKTPATWVAHLLASTQAAGIGPIREFFGD